MSESLINLLLQIPLAGMVIVVVVIFLKHEKENNLAFLNELKNLRNLYETTLSKLTEKISELSNSVNVMCDRVNKIEEKIDGKK
ncbi:MAG: hypothetical protein C0410_01885 [Anaerolinea sp.]|nr:hypothetical protein [Anaerolinea sp.]